LVVAGIFGFSLKKRRSRRAVEAFSQSGEGWSIPLFSWIDWLSGRLTHSRCSPTLKSGLSILIHRERREAMRDFITIGSAPCDEDCAQVGSPNYRKRALAECLRFIQLIRDTLGSEPEGAELRIKSFDHDFGTYVEVVCWFDTEKQESVDYAFRCESDAPATWEE